MLYYRIAILLWAIWLSFVVLRWVKYAWRTFSTETLRRPLSAEAPAKDEVGEQKNADRRLWWLAGLAMVISIVAKASALYAFGQNVGCVLRTDWAVGA